MITIADPLIDAAEIKAVTKVLTTHQLSEGQMVHQFEDRFAKFVGVNFAVATSSGTSALHTALWSAGVGPGDEVITTPFTFVATTNSILMVGATPVFVDIEENTFNIDPAQIEKIVTSKTKAIVVVNLYGQPADFSQIQKIAKKYKLIVIEDAAQSVNASFQQQKSGSLADIGCFSFYATKNITSGEGGAMTTNQLKYYQKAKQFINHGQKPGRQYEYLDIGYNYRMTNLQGAILLAQLRKIKTITKSRQNLAKIYDRGLSKRQGITIPARVSDRTHVFHQYTIRIGREFPISRAELANYLWQNKIQTKIYYSKPLYRFGHIKNKSLYQQCPIAEKAAKEVLSLPIHPNLSSADVEYIIGCIISV